MSELRANTLSDAAGTGPATLTGQSALKAWVMATSAAAVEDSFNVASSTDHGIGDYSYALTNAFGAADFRQGCSAHATGPRFSTNNETRIAAGTMATQVFVISTTGSNTDNDHELNGTGDLA